MGEDANGVGTAGDLTEAEAAVYDRQLRVWGVETQKRLNNARVLIVGCTGLAAEVAKNIALAGVGLLALMDDTPVQSAAPGNFLVPVDADPNQTVAEASVTTLQEMNPLVRVVALPGNVASLEDPTGLVAGYTVALFTGLSLKLLEQLDLSCTDKNVGFFAAASRGSTGFIFVNLHKHTYTVTVPAGDSSVTREESVNFTSLERAIFHPWAGLPPRAKTHPLFYAIRACYEFERKRYRFPMVTELGIVRQLGHDLASADGHMVSTLHHLPEDDLEEYLLGNDELAPVNAILGGVLANELLKAVARKDPPLNNFLFFSLRNGSGVVETMGEPPAS